MINKKVPVILLPPPFFWTFTHKEVCKCTFSPTNQFLNKLLYIKTRQKIPWSKKVPIFSKKFRRFSPPPYHFFWWWCLELFFWEPLDASHKILANPEKIDFFSIFGPPPQDPYCFTEIFTLSITCYFVLWEGFWGRSPPRKFGSF